MIKSKEEYLLEFDVQHPKELNELRNDSPFLSERMSIEKVGKLVGYLRDKNGYVIDMKNLKQPLSHAL